MAQARFAPDSNLFQVENSNNLIFMCAGGQS